MKKSIYKKLSERLSGDVKTDNGSIPYEGHFNAGTMTNLLSQKGGLNYDSSSALLAASLKEDQRLGEDSGVVSNFQKGLLNADPSYGEFPGRPTERFVVTSLSKGGEDLSVLKESVSRGFDVNIDFKGQSESTPKTLTDTLLTTEHLKTAQKELGLDRAPTENSFKDINSMNYVPPSFNDGTFDSYTPQSAPRFSTFPKYKAPSDRDVMFPEKRDMLADYSPERRARITEYQNSVGSLNSSVPRPLMPGGDAMRVENLAHLAETGVISKDQLKTPQFVANVYLAVGEVSQKVDGKEVVIQDQDKHMISASSYFKRLDIDPNVVDLEGKNALHHLMSREALNTSLKVGESAHAFPESKKAAISLAVKQGVSLDAVDNKGVSGKDLLNVEKEFEKTPSVTKWTHNVVAPSLPIAVDEEKRKRVSETVKMAAFESVSKEKTPNPAEKKKTLTEDAR
jgi:hypothetical protein